MVLVGSWVWRLLIKKMLGNSIILSTNNVITFNSLGGKCSL